MIEYSYYIGVAQIKLNKTEIMEGSFRTVMNLLQNIHIENTQLLLDLAKAFWFEQSKPSKNLH